MAKSWTLVAIPSFNTTLIKMKIIFLSVLALTLFSIFTNGQVASKKDLSGIKSSTLIILKNDNDKADEKQLEKLKNKPDKLAEYEKAIKSAKEMNDNFVTAVQSSWHLSKLDTNCSYFGQIDPSTKSAYALYFKIMKVEIIDERTQAVKRTIDPPYIGVFVGMFRNGKEKEVYADIGIPINSQFPDFFHALTVLQQYFTSLENGSWKKLACIGCIPDLYRVLADKKNETLSKINLLIDQKYLSEKLTETTVRKIYPFPFKIITTEEIERTIKNNEKGYAFLAPTIIPNELISMPLWNSFHVIDISESKLIGFDKGSLTSPNTKEIPLTEAALKNIASRGD
jgi:hypothetical protein